MGRKNRGTRVPQRSRNLPDAAGSSHTRRLAMIHGKIPENRRGGEGYMLGLVKPDAICHGNPLRPKHAFITEGKAAKALFNARANHELVGTGKIEERYYLCPHGTNSLAPYNARIDLSGVVEHYHLTSQPARPDEETP